jgi:hypothetical protein
MFVKSHSDLLRNLVKQLDTNEFDKTLELLIAIMFGKDLHRLDLFNIKLDGFTY